jgi:hypothetical protein
MERFVITLNDIISLNERLMGELYQSRKTPLASKANSQTVWNYRTPAAPGVMRGFHQ